MSARRTASRIARASLAALVLSAACSVPALAASASGCERACMPRIVATGHAELDVPPARASFSIGVITESATAAEASAENARVYNAVSQALRKAGLAPRDIASSRLSIFPRWTYDQASGRQHRAGVEATHTLEIDTANLSHLGRLVDAALEAGASSVSAFNFTADHPAAARRRALAEAVEDAHEDAKTMAHAAGGALGAVLEVSSQEANVVVPAVRLEQAMAPVRAGASGSPSGESFIPRDIEVRARVLGQWQFVPVGR